MSKIETKAIDELYLELSQFTGATTAREIKLQSTVKELRDAMAPFAKAVLSSVGPIATSQLSFADWSRMVTAYNRSET